MYGRRTTMSTRDKSRPLLIVNPQSGGGKTGRTFDQMRAPIERAIGDVDVATTERGRHAVEIARDAARDGRSAVIAVGGDGSVHEVANGLMTARDEGVSELPKLGVIGTGTGGDFRRTLGIDHRLDRYASAIASGKTRRVDIGRVSYTTHDGAPATAYFINILSVGLGGLVDQLVAKATRSLGGTLAYFSASVQGLLQSEIGHLTAEVSLAGEARTLQFSSRNVAICNGRYFGSGMHVAPMAKVDDGVFEVIDQGAAPKLRFAMVSSKVYKGEHINHPDTKHFRCDRIKLSLQNADVSHRFLLDVDGEPLGRLPMEIEVVPAALEVFAEGP